MPVARSLYPRRWLTEERGPIWWGAGPKGADEPERPYPTHSPADIARSVLPPASPVTATVNGAALVMDFGGLARSSFEE